MYIIYSLMDNSRDGQSSSSCTKFQLQSRHYDAASHCSVFCQQELLLTIGNDGELNLYRQNYKKQYKHQSTHKMYSLDLCSFDCPVIAYDIIQDGKSWKLIVISVDNRIAACRIIEKKDVVVFAQIKFQQAKEDIVSCAWLGSQNKVILGGAKGHIFILELNSKEKALQFQAGGSKIKLFRWQEAIYVATKTSISRLLLKLKFELKTLLSLDTQILDFTMSQKQNYNFLVVLIKDKLLFFYLENMQLQQQVFPLKNQLHIGRLGWGKGFNEIGVYQPLQEGTDVTVYECNLSGIWNRVQD